MHFQIHERFQNLKAQILSIVDNFKAGGKDFVIGRRNSIKEFEAGGIHIIVKSFGRPNVVNKVIYRFFRKSKARRSYEYAGRLLKEGIGTPAPIAYFENYGPFSLKESYYLCELLVADLTFRELVEIPDFPDHENILRQFIHFCFALHEKGIEFKDHSPGNTLIKKTADGSYSFYLVDLNRMAFHTAMDFNQRMENLKRLTPKEDMVAVMSNEYAKLYGKPEQAVFELLWHKTSEFQRKFWRKRALKAKLKFLKK